MAVVSFPARNKLAYPAGTKAGIDLSHPAAQGMSDGNGFSVVSANGGDLVNLTNGRIGTISGTPVTAIRSHIGFGVNTQGASDHIDFAGNAATTALPQTFGAIVQFDSIVAGYQNILAADSAALGYLGLNASSILTIFDGNQDISATAITPAANTPYFFATSAPANNAGNVHFVALNLRTGNLVLQTAAGPGFGPFALTGTYRIGGFANQPLLGTLAAGMYAPTYLTMLQLVQWAADPWAFWYPPKQRSRVAAAAAATFLAGWGQQTNLPVLGTGTY